MATQAVTVTEPSDKKAKLATWSNLFQGDDGAPVNFSEYPDKTVQFLGTEGAGLTIALEGSMDQVNWVSLTTNGTDAIAGLGLHYVWENPLYIRPNLTGGDGTTNINALLLAPTR